MRIALTGNPNSGKTTMYNALTGRNEKIGNWAGVTVDRKESPIKKDHYDGAKELIAVDLPGAYSMSPFTSEESITFPVELPFQADHSSQVDHPFQAGLHPSVSDLLQLLFVHNSGTLVRRPVIVFHMMYKISFASPPCMICFFHLN